MVDVLMQVMVRLFCASIVLATQFAHADRFDERLQLRPLNDEYVLAHFEFETIGFVSEYHLFPKSLAQIVDQYNVEELHLSLTKGRWLSSFGTPISPAPYGAETWAWISGANSESVSSQWRSLQAKLSGLLCASLNQIDDTNTLTPEHAFRPEGDAFCADQNRTTELRYGLLPRENICTENLTPWLKLLPCRSAAGLGKLLNPLKVLDSHYHSMQLHVIPSCYMVEEDENNGCISRKSLFTLSFSSVFRTSTKGSATKFSLDSLFGEQSVAPCPVAQGSVIALELPDYSRKVFPKFSAQVDDYLASREELTRIDKYHDPKDVAPFITDSSSDLQVSPVANEMHSTGPRVVLLFDLWSKPESLSISWPRNQFRDVQDQPMSAYTPPISTARYLTGEGQQYGGVAVNVNNDHPTETLKILYFDTYPWFVRIYFHTLKIWINGELIEPFSDLEMFSFEPSKWRSSPARMEFVTSLPPNASLLLTFEFEKTFVTINEFPPDYNRGFDIGSSVVTILEPASVSSASRSIPIESDEDYGKLYLAVVPKRVPSRPYRIYSTQLLLMLSSPDMSMPFNVIAFTSTVLAFFFGSMFNTLFKSVPELQARAPSKRMNKLRERIRKVLRKITGIFRRG